MIPIGTVKNNRYCIIEQIGQGGTSNVYYVRDNRLGKFWAMKEISRRSGLGKVMALREVDMLRSIDFPMFPKIVDAWQDSKSIYIVSDYVNGVSLNHIIKDIAVSYRQSIEWAGQILTALDYLHNLSPPILYLDLKPENILVRPDGSLALIDFGIAGRTEGSRLPLGTPGYAAPEQYGKGENSPDERTDIYAFGMTYFFIRTGLPPVDSDNNQFISDSEILTGKEKSFLKKCTAGNMDDRFANVSATIQALRNLNNLQRIKYKKGIKVIFAVSLLLLIVCLRASMKENQLREKAALEMVNKSNMYMKDGNYTPEGIRVITSFLNSGCLPEEAKQHYTYEVAKYYFEEQKDYTNAYRLFRSIDQISFPEAKYYTELCEIELGYGIDIDRIRECLGNFYKYSRGSVTDIRQVDNILFIAECFTKYEPVKLVGIQKAITILEEETELVNDCLNDRAEGKELTIVLKERIDNLKKMAEMIEKSSIQ